MWTELFTFVKGYKETHGCLADVTKVVLRDETKHSSVFEELCKLTKASVGKGTVSKRNFQKFPTDIIAEDTFD